MVNITEEDIKNRIYQKYIKPTKNNKEEYIGIEIEIPIINLNKEPVNFNVVHKVTNIFKDKFNNFDIEETDYEGNINALKNKSNNDIICFDCSYNNIEFAMGKEKDLFTINKRFRKYYKFIKKELEKNNHTLVGMGINPYWKYNVKEPIPNERYLMLYHHLKTYPQYKNPMYFHHYPEYGLFSSASQIQLDVPYDELINTINISTKLEPIKAILFSNSVFLGENTDYLCYRDIFWEYSTHGINPHNIGMYDFKLKDINSLINYLSTLNIYCVVRDGHYINFTSMNLYNYFSKDKITGDYYDNGEYKTIEFTPSLDDIDYVRSFKFIDLTFRGTIEYRSVCTQPIKDTISSPAFQIGLKHKVNELNELFDNSDLYNHGYSSSELRKLFIKKDLPKFISEDELYDLCKKIVDLSREGLKERGYGEEVFLKPIYENIKNRTNPGKRLLSALDNNISLDSIIKEYGKLD